MVPPRQSAAADELSVPTGTLPPYRSRQNAAPSSVSILSSGAVWSSIAAEFGLLPGSAVDELLGPGSPPAGCLAADRRILGVATRAGRVLYPGFQFDPAVRSVQPLIVGVARIGRSSGCRDRRILAWFCVPTARLDGKRPVDRMPDADAVLAAAAADLSWDRWRGLLS